MASYRRSSNSSRYSSASGSGNRYPGSGSESVRRNPDQDLLRQYEPHDRSRCTFCRICDGTDVTSHKDKILYQTDDLVVFHDIRPATKYHLLVVTKEHIRDVEHLTGSHIGLLDRMVWTAGQVLSSTVSSSESQDAAGPNTLMGFHWPPYITVSHLHLHVLYPSDQLNYVGRRIFRPNSFRFVLPEFIRDRLQRMETESRDNRESSVSSWSWR